MAEAPPPAHPDRKGHWEGIYAQKAPEQVSWHQAHPEISLALIAEAARDRATPIIDVGGGASRLVDHLLRAGYTRLSVLDIAAAALAQARARLGPAARRVSWLEQDVTAGLGQRRFGLWHDRAVFHFLTDPRDRDLYLRALGQALQPGGALIVATFGPDGPQRCSGLPVQRYSPAALAHTLGPEYELRDSRSEAHRTPAGAVQHFHYCRFERSP